MYKTDDFKLKKLTLAFLVKGEKVLLAMKKRGFGQGLWNGFGGKFDMQKDKNIIDTLIRETQEESNTTPTSYQKVAQINFYYPNRDSDGINWNHRVVIFLVDSWQGKVKESEEMKPKWFKKDQLPLDKMWKADTYWLPLVLAGKAIKGEFFYDQDKKLVEFKLVDI